MFILFPIRKAICLVILLKKEYDLHMHHNTCTKLEGNQGIAKIGVTFNNLFPFKLETINLSCFTVVDKKKFQNCGMIGLDT